MIQHVSCPRYATEADIPRIRWILTDPSVASTFGALTIGGEPWDKAFADLAWWIAPGLVLAAEIRRDWSAWVHVAALPWARGQPAIEAARFVIDALFVGTPVTRLCGWMSSDLRGGGLFSRRLGFRVRLRRRGKLLFVLTREVWEGQLTEVCVG